ncbi:hypothetical protein TH47_05620 [Thalassospira sp. MCCC 1A02803]|jgi:hypothetical protein|nr:hypothetical protein AUQ41_08140 [Thalassospira sp. MCCC 1A02898]ONH85445.1 hypothetical protein TH47_05620 [Thalassospira sp. MCCC 1A02803]
MPYRIAPAAFTGLGAVPSLRQKARVAVEIGLLHLPRIPACAQRSETCCDVKNKGVLMQNFLLRARARALAILVFSPRGYSLVTPCSLIRGTPKRGSEFSFFESEAAIVFFLFADLLAVREYLNAECGV